MGKISVKPQMVLARGGMRQDDHVLMTYYCSNVLGRLFSGAQIETEHARGSSITSNITQKLSRRSEDRLDVQSQALHDIQTLMQSSCHFMNHWVVANGEHASKCKICMHVLHFRQEWTGLTCRCRTLGSHLALRAWCDCGAGPARVCAQGPLGTATTVAGCCLEGRTRG